MESSYIPSQTIVSLIADYVQAPIRIDTFIAAHISGYSRSFFQKIIENGGVSLNSKIINKPSVLIRLDDKITVEFPKILPLGEFRPLAENTQVDVIFEHPHFLVINKPSSLSVHPPSFQNTTPTLVDWLICHFKEVSNVGCSERPGIVHRLDKDTSGIIIIAKNNYAHAIFGDMFKNRTIKKTYHALVHGHAPESGTIDYAISRHQIIKTKMTHTIPSGRASITHYKVIKYFSDMSLLEVNPITGRTHQIRVHCAAIGHPIVGDKLYGNSSKLINRQALHAYSVSFNFENQPYFFIADIQEDFKKLLESL